MSARKPGPTGPLAYPISLDIICITRASRSRLEWATQRQGRGHLTIAEAMAEGARSANNLTIGEEQWWSASPAGQRGEPCPYRYGVVVSLYCPDCNLTGLRPRCRVHNAKNACPTCKGTAKLPLYQPLTRPSV